MLVRDSKIPIMKSVLELVDPVTKRVDFDKEQAKRAILYDEPLNVNGKDYYLNYRVKEWISTTCLYKDELTTAKVEEEYWQHNKDFYWERPVTIQEFIRNPDYLGKIYGENMNKWWGRILDIVYPRNFQKRFCEVVASLAIGTGKTTAAAISLSYEMYKLMCLKSPTSYYPNLVKGTKIVFSLFNVSRDLAYQVTFDPFRTIFAESPYFRERVVIPGRNSLTEYGIYITEDIRMDLGSLDRNALGKAIFGAVLDEGNFNRVEDQTLKSYSALRTRIASRFGTVYGFPGILWAVSSPLTDADSINTLINKADPKTTYVLDDTAQWEVWPDYTRYTLNKRFPVYMGDANTDPKIIMSGTKSLEKYDSNKVIMVPYNLYPLFKADVYKNLRDLAGRRVAGAMNLFRSVELLRSVFTAPTPMKTVEPIKLDFYDRDDKIMNYLNIDYFKNPLYSDCTRCIHLDEAEADGVNRYGIAATYCRHIEKEIYPYKKGLDVFDQETPAIEMTDRFYYVDWAIAIEAKAGQKIPLRRIREFLIWLKEIGYPIELITGDKPTQATRNDLEQDGFKTEYQSVDKERDCWISFRSEVENHSIIIPRIPLAIKEAQHLIDDGEKIDHCKAFPDGTPGSKDMMDAIVGSYYACKTAKRVNGITTLDHKALDTSYKRRVAQIKNRIIGYNDINPEALINFIKT